MNWPFRKKVSQPQPSPALLDDTPGKLTKQERLQAILISYKTGKLTIEKAMNLIYVWKNSNG